MLMLAWLATDWRFVVRAYLDFAFPIAAVRLWRLSARSRSFKIWKL